MEDPFIAARKLAIRKAYPYCLLFLILVVADAIIVAALILRT
jgi:hypothetical protein